MRGPCVVAVVFVVAVGAHLRITPSLEVVFLSPRFSGSGYVVRVIVTVSKCYVYIVTTCERQDVY